jgi:hypothetical protein
MPAAAAIFSVIATCRLHTLDPFQYLEEILRVLPYGREIANLAITETGPSRSAARPSGADPGLLRS